MIKDISSIGIILMTALVVYRSSTINHAIEIDELYKRQADATFWIENSNRLQTIELESVGVGLLGFKGGNPSHLIPREDKQKIHPLQLDELVSELPNEIIDLEVALVLVQNEQFSVIGIQEVTDFSRDRESTINANLSLLFPRQRILQHPSQSELNK